MMVSQRIVHSLYSADFETYKLLLQLKMFPFQFIHTLDTCYVKGIAVQLLIEIEGKSDCIIYSSCPNNSTKDWLTTGHQTHRDCHTANKRCGQVSLSHDVTSRVSSGFTFFCKPMHFFHSSCWKKESVPLCYFPYPEANWDPFQYFEIFMI